MGTSDHERDGGEPWRDDLPNTWTNCESDPPLGAGITDDPDVIKRPDATVFELEGSATHWIRAANEDVLYPTDYR